MEHFYDFNINNLPGIASSEFNDNEEDQYIESHNVNGKKAFRCTYNNCDKIFKYKSDIVRHGLIHSKTRPYYCPYEGCKKSFKRPDVLDGHIRTHTKQLPFECEEPGCNAKFTSNAGLKYHVLKHKGDKPFMCNYDGCGRSFMTLAQLKQHESTLKYHKNTVPATPMKVDEDVVSKVIVYETKEKKVDSEYYMPKPRVAKTLTWEVKNVNELDEPVKVQAPESTNNAAQFEMMMRHFVEENQALKMKLEECNQKLINFNEEPAFTYQTELKPEFFQMDSPVSPNLYELNGFRSPLPQVDLTAFRPMEYPYENIFEFMRDGGNSPTMM